MFSRQSGSSVISFMAGLAVGAGLEYLLDPDVGAKRRRAVVDHLGGMSESVSDRVRHLSASASGGLSRGSQTAGHYLHTLRERWGRHGMDRHTMDQADAGGSPLGAVALCSAVLGALGLGAVLMYALDPQMGNRRRRLAQDKLRGRWNHLRAEARRKARYVGGHLKGYAHEARSALRTEHVTDEQLRERIRARLGHVSSQAAQITVDVHDGIVTLRGTIPDASAGEILSTVRSTRGVQSVEDQLQRS